jgi:hypothetical protein
MEGIMPSKSRAQHNFMEMVAHDPKAAKRVGVPQSVGRDFSAADKGRPMTSYAKGGDIRPANYAQGGPVLGKTSQFLKTPDEFRTDNSNATDENWGKKGGASSMSKRTGDKCLPAVKPRK